jgi:serine/threonine protein kinase/tetratricopeptide (TPR) repeat protein
LKCPRCQAENPETSRFCADCGTQLGGQVPDSPESGTCPKNSKFVPTEVTETLQTPVQELTTGSTLAGRYQIIEELGKGGMGKVFKVFDAKIKEKIALKLIKPETASDGDMIERFSNEIRLSRRIGHQNVCRMFDIGEAEGAHFITMEYVHGEDLKSMIRMSGSLSLGMLLSVGKQVSDGLAEAHSLGVVHRDLKPQNIMIDRNGNAKIMDFGIARSVRERGITGPSVLVGTPEYMSPEQAEAKEVDQRSDIYSLGVVLYEMATSRVPFEGETALSIAMKHKGEIPKNPQKLNPSIPDDLSGVILKCLEKDRAKRYQSAFDVRSELERIEKGIPTAERFVLERKPITSREITVTLKLKKVVVPLSAALAVLVLAFIGWRLFLQKKSSISLARIRSIAVMPFEDLSLQKDQGYICEGLADELITRLIGVEGLRIPARASAFLLRGKEPREIGQRLAVDAVLDGTLLRADQKIHVNIQIVDARNGYGLWSGKFDGDEKELFDLRDEIAQKILESLKVSLLGEDKARVVKSYTENLEAYNLYLQGRYFWNKRVTDDVKKAIDYFEQAIALDPNFALAHAGLADSYLVLPMYGEYRTSETLPKAKAAISKALAIDDTLAEAHTSLAWLKELEWDNSGAEEQYKRAIELNPNYPTAHQWYSGLLENVGRLDESLVEMKRALELDPLSLIINVNLASVFFDRGEIDRAIDQCHKTLELDPGFGNGQWLLGICLLEKGMLEEAVAALEKANKLYGRSPYALGDLGRAYAASGDKAKAMEVLSILKDFLQRGYTVNLEIALVHLGLGDKDKAFEWLGKACDDQDEKVDVKFSNFNVDPRWASLRSDPRYQLLLKKLHLEK